MKNHKVLLLASYCGDRDSKCTDSKPCIDCLAMCNCFTVSDEAINTENYIGTLDYLTEI